MYKNGRHPVRKCGKCKLNFRTHCGVYENPHEMWGTHRKCPGFMNEKVYAAYLEKEERLTKTNGKKSSVAARRKTARLRNTEPHHDGRLVIGRKLTG